MPILSVPSTRRLVSRVFTATILSATPLATHAAPLETHEYLQAFDGQWWFENQLGEHRSTKETKSECTYTNQPKMRFTLECKTEAKIIGKGKHRFVAPLLGISPRLFENSQATDLALRTKIANKLCSSYAVKIGKRKLKLAARTQGTDTQCVSDEIKITKKPIQFETAWASTTNVKYTADMDTYAYQSLREPVVPQATLTFPVDTTLKVTATPANAFLELNGKPATAQGLSSKILAQQKVEIKDSAIREFHPLATANLAQRLEIKSNRLNDVTALIDGDYETAWCVSLGNDRPYLEIRNPNPDRELVWQQILVANGDWQSNENFHKNTGPADVRVRPCEEPSTPALKKYRERMITAARAYTESWFGETGRSQDEAWPRFFTTETFGARPKNNEIIQDYLSADRCTRLEFTPRPTQSQNAKFCISELILKVEDRTEKNMFARESQDPAAAKRLAEFLRGKDDSVN